MAWETRNGRRYYYRKERIAGRVISIYCGVGETALLAEELTSQGKQQRTDERAAIAELAAEDAKAEAIEREVSDLIKAYLLANGFHQHKRTWRKSRDAGIIGSERQ